MKRLILTSTLFLLFVGNGFSQSAYIGWNPSGNFKTNLPENDQKSSVVLEDYRSHELIAGQDNAPYLLTELRRKIKLNDDKGIESFNKIYIHHPDNAELVKVMARAILPDGRVIPVPENKILDVNEEGTRYRKFAMEGLVNGSIVEYYSSFKRDPLTFSIENFSIGTSPVEEARFRLTIPAHLIFDVKGYNGFEKVMDSVIEEERITEWSARKLPYISDEKYSGRDRYLSNVQYKLSYNLAREKSVRMNTWNELAKGVYSSTHELSKKEIAAVETLVKKINIKSDAFEEQKISQLDDYIKTHFNIDEDAIGDDVDQIDRIVKSKTTNKIGAVKLYIALFEKYNIAHQLVIPSKRNEMPLDEEFENYRLVDEFIIYFPGTRQALDPGDATTRYPIINPYWAGTNGLFIRETSIGDFKTALAEFDSIPILPYEASTSDIEATLSVNPSGDTVMIKSMQLLTGYSASSYRPIFKFLEKDKQDEVVKDIIKNVGKSTVISNIKVDNPEMTHSLTNAPLRIHGEIKSAELVERAGTDLLVKLGEVIGTQAEMYQEDERQLPILLSYPHTLKRILRFKVPQGYRVKNLKDVEFNVTDSKKTMGFVSAYTLEGDEIKVDVNEYYLQTEYPKDQIDIFRKVINAAADFNKVVLVLEKI